jgi:murein DD-endopeptidase MepM/ murein hydrolase activator NlpD
MKYNLFVFACLILISCGDDKNVQVIELGNEQISEELIPVPEKELKVKYNIELDGYIIEETKIKNGEFISKILTSKNIEYPEIQKVEDQSKDIFNVRKLRTGKPYTLLIRDDSTHTLDYMIYEIDQINYVVYDFVDSVHVYRGEKPVTIVEKTASGIIESSLWNTMVENNLDQDLILDLSDIYAWTIDFYHIQKGDSFKVIYTQKLVEGKNVGVERILAAEFTHHETPLSAYLFESNGIEDYFDDNGKNLRKAFLRAPVKFSRISSRYSGKRFHPVTKRYKAHLGTDYAAATGTPIMATGDGVIVASTYKKFNGNYVKVKHNATYTTQYLHMSKRAVKVGQMVKQGETIGYVGSTGLATGPHVCYRFWKNGKQVDPYRQDLPESEPIQANEQEAFEKVKMEFSQRLKDIFIGNSTEIVLSN